MLKILLTCRQKTFQKDRIQKSLNRLDLCVADSLVIRQKCNRNQNLNSPLFFSPLFLVSTNWSSVRSLTLFFYIQSVSSFLIALCFSLYTYVLPQYLFFCFPFFLCHDERRPRSTEQEEKKQQQQQQQQPRFPNRGKGARKRWRRERPAAYSFSNFLPSLKAQARVAGRRTAGGAVATVTTPGSFTARSVNVSASTFEPDPTATAHSINFALAPFLLADLRAELLASDLDGVSARRWPVSAITITAFTDAGAGRRKERYRPASVPVGHEVSSHCP